AGELASRISMKRPSKIEVSTGRLMNTPTGSFTTRATIASRIARAIHANVTAKTEPLGKGLEFVNAITSDGTPSRATGYATDLAARTTRIGAIATTRPSFGRVSAGASSSGTRTTRQATSNPGRRVARP